jgi:TolB-like protein/Tfp pilus assembly protein PilF
MPDDGSPPNARPGADHLDSWGEIAAYLHRSVSTVQRWEKHEGLPVHRIAHHKLGSVYAKAAELDAWHVAHSRAGRTPAAGEDPAARIRLAVLPFQNLSASPEQDYFSDGLTEELITHLARLRPDRLAVIARTSAMGYRNTDKDVRAIGAELGVGYVLEGSVRRSGDQVRVTAQLITAADGCHLWAESYDEELTGFIAIQTAIAERVGDSLSFHLLSPHHASHARARRTSPEAFDAYLKGRYFLGPRRPDDFQRARAYFERAVELDPLFAPAHAGVAESDALLGFWGFGVLPPRVAFPRAKAAVQRALALDPDLAEAQATLGFLRQQFDWELADAERLLRLALEINPSYATGHQWYAGCLAAQARWDEARAEIALARELDPLSPAVTQTAAWLHFLAGDYEAARQDCARIVEIHPNLAMVHLLLAGVYCFTGRRAETFREHDAFDRIVGETAFATTFRASHHARLGERAQAEEALQRLRGLAAASSVPSWQFALVHAALGDADEAFAALERAVEERSDVLVYLKVDPHWDPIRSDARFAALLRRTGLG